MRCAASIRKSVLRAKATSRNPKRDSVIPLYQARVSPVSVFHVITMQETGFVGSCWRTYREHSLIQQVCFHSSGRMKILPGCLLAREMLPVPTNAFVCSPRIRKPSACRRHSIQSPCMALILRCVPIFTEKSVPREYRLQRWRT